MSNKIVLVLPTWGSPYIFGELNGKNDLKVLQGAVQGFVQEFDRPHLMIHPMFAEKGRWLLARQILTSKSVKVYVNEDGMEKCCPNMATIKTGLAASRLCPQLFGDVALVVPPKVFQALGIDPDVLTLHRPTHYTLDFDPSDADDEPEWDDEQKNTCWEFDTEEDQSKFIKEIEEKGYDYRASYGFCYKKKCPGDVEDRDE